MGVSNNLRSWRLGVLASLALALISSVPQLYLCYVRGSEWNGSFAYFDTDELAYCAYENSIIDGRPRRNDPYNGSDSQTFETLFSIQFFPPYVLAFVGRLFSLSASKTFVLLAPLVAASATLIIFKLLSDTTENYAFAAASSIALLCVGTFAIEHPSLWFLPFLRRYVPAFPFPLCLAMLLFLWKSLTKRHLIWPIASATVFVLLIYSYFFLWTAAAANLGFAVILFLVGRPEDRRHTLTVAGIIVFIGAVALVPYSWLISHRAPTMDQAQVLELTHAPDLFRASEVLGLALCIMVIWLVRTKRIDWRNPSVLFLLSLALAPLGIFNQQTLTGRSLQPFHYTQFIANYMVLIATFILIALAWKRMPKWIPLGIAVVTVALGLLLALSVARLTLAANVLIDQKRLVALRLKRDNNKQVVFASDALMTMLIPTEAQNPMLWSRYSYIFGNISAGERKQSFFKYLYYSGFDEAKFVHAMTEDFTSRVEVFGAERTNPSLTANHQAITAQDIKVAYQEYETYCRNFTRDDAAKPILGYAIVLTNVDLTNLDRWYSRNEGERVGDFIVYKLSLK